MHSSSESPSREELGFSELDRLIVSELKGQGKHFESLGDKTETRQQCLPWLKGDVTKQKNLAWLYWDHSSLF